MSAKRNVSLETLTRKAELARTDVEVIGVGAVNSSDSDSSETNDRLAVRGNNVSSQLIETWQKE